MVALSLSLPALPSLPSLPRLPSASSIRALMDPEPQVFYPALARTRSPDRPRASRDRRDSSSSTRSSSSARMAASPSRSGLHRLRTGLGHLRGASRSAVDLCEGREDRTADSLKELGRRHSISLQQHRPDGGETVCSPDMPVASRGTPSRFEPALSAAVSRSHTPSGSPSRPVHRRSRSALPAPVGARPSNSSAYVPHGRLVEFSRNPLTSSSAVSLPTLAEGELEEVSPDFPAIGLHAGDRIHHRTFSRTSSSTVGSSQSPATPASPTSSSGTSLAAAGPISPFTLEAELPLEMDISVATEVDTTPKAKGRRYCGTREPVLGSYEAFSVPPPLPVARLRPPPSPRAWSDSNVVTRRRVHPFGIPLTVSNQTTSNSCAVSDVAVMATWSHTLDGGTAPLDAARDVGDTSDRLKEKLRSLSLLDVGCGEDADVLGRHAGSAPTSTVDTPGQWVPLPPSAIWVPRNPALGTQPHQPRYPQSSTSHRQMHSSPHFLLSPPMSSASSPRHSNVPGSMPPPPVPVASTSRSSSPIRPGHRRTASRLRSPQLLSLPLDDSPVSTHALHRSSSLPSNHQHNRRPSTSASSISFPLKPQQAGSIHLLDDSASGYQADAWQGSPLMRTQSAMEAESSAGDTGKGRWWQARRFGISGNGASAPDHHTSRYPKVEVVPDEAARPSLDPGRSRREDSPENERFIDFDDI